MKVLRWLSTSQTTAPVSTWETIRRKAYELELLQPDSKVADEEIMNLILTPGFSTAGKVTQAAGRGVGMDVVANEVKKLGGSLRISSVTGQGTNFTVRLPFTLAITQALIVRTGDEVYALPLPSRRRRCTHSARGTRESAESERADLPIW